MNYPVRIAVYLAVIALAPTLNEPWMIALQAAAGGIMLGVRLDQWLDERARRDLANLTRGMPRS